MKAKMKHLRGAGITRLLLLALVVAAPCASASQREDLLTLRNTMIGVIESLVAQGTLTEDEARAMIARAEQEAQEEAARVAAEDEVDPSTVRVTYVPEVVKDELRNEIMSSLRQEVAEEVVSQARSESWGVPGALPAWLSDIRWSADFRVRGRTDLFDDGNQPNFYRNFQAINDAGGIGFAGQDALLNVSEDRERLAARLRFGIDMRIANNWYAGARLTTSNGSPLTRNITLGQRETESFNTIVDLAYVHYRSRYLMFSGGRIPNPFVRTEMVWDDDITFEGIAFTGRYPLENIGTESSVFLTAGAFPLEEVEFSANDKWLYGSQLGLQLGFGSGGGLTLASSYYAYENIAGERNDPGSQLLDFTAPEFLQKGNTLFDIRNDSDPATGRFALVSDFKIWDALLRLDSGALFAGPKGRPVHLQLTGHYVENRGWDDEEIFERTGLDNLDERTDGYTVRLGLGSPRIDAFGDWNIAAYFRHLKRDAVIDAFTDSNFRLGGTDAEGWGVEMRMALTENTWFDLQYITASEIDGPPLSIDLFQLDLNARF